MPRQGTLFQELHYDVSVVMVSYQTGTVLWRAITNVLAQDGLRELIVVDNGNPKQTTERLHLLAKEEDRLKVISGHGNIGFARGCNLGAGTAEGEYLMFLAPDALPERDTLLRLVDTLRMNKDAWMAAPRIFTPYGDEHKNSRRNPLTLNTLLSEVTGLARLFPNSPRFERLYLNTQPVPEAPVSMPVVSSVCMLLRRERFAATEGMDEHYFLQGAGPDFCQQIAQMGGNILFVPDVAVTYYDRVHGVSRLTLEWHHTREYIHYFFKNFKGAYLPGILPLLAVGFSLRLVVKTLLNLILKPRFFKKRKPSRYERSASDLLARFADFAISEEALHKAGKYDISAHQPFLVVGGTSPTGLCLIRRLLGTGMKVIALHHSKIIDFDHSKLSWVYADLNRPLLGLDAYAPHTVLYLAPLGFLPEHLETFAKIGASRLVALSCMEASGTLAHTLHDAENDVLRTAPVLNLDVTILRPALTYGLDMDEPVTAMIKALKRWRFLPLPPPSQGHVAPVHADDVAIACLQVLHQPRTVGRGYDLPGGKAISIEAMLTHLFDSQNKKPRLLRCKTPWLYRLLCRVMRIERLKAGAIPDSTSSAAGRDFAYNARPFIPETTTEETD